MSVVLIDVLFAEVWISGERGASFVFSMTCSRDPATSADSASKFLRFAIKPEKGEKNVSHGYRFMEGAVPLKNSCTERDSSRSTRELQILGIS
jgi:hypothetical protein